MLGVIAVCFVFGLLALLLSLSRWLAHRPWAAAGNLAVALVLLMLSQWLWPPVLHLQTYQPMHKQGLVAQLHCERTGPGTYRLTLTRLPDGKMQVFEMTGDEWQLGIRTLVWTGRAASVGLPASFRLDRLSGRYVRTELKAEERSQDTPTAKSLPAPAGYALSDEDEPGEDIWAQARTESWWKNHLDARQVLTAWRPLADGARYDVAMLRGTAPLQVTLDAQPANEAAAKAMRYTQNGNVRTKD